MSDIDVLSPTCFFTFIKRKADSHFTHIRLPENIVITKNSIFCATLSSLVKVCWNNYCLPENMHFVLKNNKWLNSLPSILQWVYYLSCISVEVWFMTPVDHYSIIILFVDTSKPLDLGQKQPTEHTFVKI